MTYISNHGLKYTSLIFRKKGSSPSC